MENQRPIQLSARAQCLPLAAACEELRRDRVCVGLRPRDPGPSDDLGHYLQAPLLTTAPQPLVLVAVLGMFDSADMLLAHDARCEAGGLQLTVRITKFQGRVAANVQRLGVVVVDLTSLPPANYACELTLDRYVYASYGKPETANFDSSSNHLQALVITERGR